MSTRSQQNYASSRAYRQNRRHGNQRPVPKPEAPSVDLTSVKPVPLSRLQFGTVVWAHLNFVGEPKGKPRPCVVLSVTGRTVRVLPGTTSDRRHDRRDHVELVDLSDAGLHRPTGICARPVDLERIDLINICGEISDGDESRIGPVVAEFAAISSSPPQSDLAA